MVINGLRKLIKDYQTKENVTLSWIAHEIGVSDKTLFTILESENIPKTETFYKLSKLIGFDLSIIDGVTNRTNISMTNNLKGVGVQSNVQMNGVQDADYLRRENELLKSQLKDKETIISLLKSKSS